MLFTEKNVTGALGTPLHVSAWEPDGAAAGVIQLVHGLGECAGPYRALARRFTDMGWAVYLHDQQGHGKTPGKRGVAASYESLLEDIDVVRSRIALEQPRLPVVLYGHAMGGNLALNHILRSAVTDRYTRVIVTGAWLRLSRTYPEAVLKTLRGLARVMPRFTLHTVDSEALPEPQTGEHGLRHNQIGAALLLEVLSAGEYAVKEAGRFPLPLLYLQGGEDKTVDPAGAAAFIAGAGAGVQYHVYPAQTHELHSGPLREDVFGEIMEFIRKI